MKLNKNKIVFGGVITVVLIFLVSYSLLLINESEDDTGTLKQTEVPLLEDDKQTYSSKLDAINDLKEVRETNAPSIYDEKLMDSLGYFDADFQEKEKQRIVDSIYKQNRINTSNRDYRPKKETVEINPTIKTEDSLNQVEADRIELKEIGLEHQLFFASNPKFQDKINVESTIPPIPVVVDQTQIVKKEYRLQMRLSEATILNGHSFPKNTKVFGFVSFKPNRVMVNISNINHHKVNLKAFDLLDGSEGIYFENSYRAEAKTEVIGDIVDDINISGVPQISGLKSVFSRSNQHVKVTILNNYKLLLKPTL
ncbi:conjugative transposon protein TraM [Formosa agariphila KMM 3901]|uniref:Conjugative transposon protein TraM n=1 Tax=Formosa agariphila (strain DSM 15362 / KCTC 12365 / LMG 23005 / KMM 3901 / M-2Alg 35-1) TaxID=1347342 RepID=T2KRZ3_FORAG|nr:conjugative transposon protein TraM [Formosa agariphila]CDF80844.1 conjugative transposon protein TraM [Formosa agariphila KMM 3901]